MKNIKEVNEKSFAAEAYRSVRANLSFCDIDDNIKTILFTSTKQNEGKTTIVSNVAYSFSKLEKSKVLLIDLDLRNPSVHKAFEINNKQGIINFLREETPIEKCVHEIDESMHILTTGGILDNPTELLSSKKMKNFLQDIKSQYDYIFVDSPSAGVVSDAVVISSLVDGVVYVVGMKDTDLSFAQETVENLRKCNANIIGCILNKFDAKQSNYGYYYSGYYYGEEEKEHKHKSNIDKKFTVGKKVKLQQQK